MEVVRLSFRESPDDKEMRSMIIANYDLRLLSQKDNTALVHIVFKTKQQQLPNIGFVTYDDADIGDIQGDIHHTYSAFCPPSDCLDDFIDAQPAVGDTLIMQLEWFEDLHNEHLVGVRLLYRSSEKSGSFTPWQVSRAPAHMKLAVLTDLENILILDQNAYDIYQLQGDFYRYHMKCGLCAEINFQCRMGVYNCGHIICPHCNSKCKEIRATCPWCQQIVDTFLPVIVRDYPCPIDNCVREKGDSDGWLLPCGCTLNHSEPLTTAFFRCPFTCCGKEYKTASYGTRLRIPYW